MEEICTYLERLITATYLVETIFDPRGHCTSCNTHNSIGAGRRFLINLVTFFALKFLQEGNFIIDIERHRLLLMIMLFAGRTTRD